MFEAIILSSNVTKFELLGYFGHVHCPEQF